MYAVNEKFYNQLIDKKAEYSISKAGYVSEDVLAKSSVLSPISPRRRLIISGVFVGVLLSLGLFIALSVL